MPRLARYSEIFESAERMSGLERKAPTIRSFKTGSLNRSHHLVSVAVSSAPLEAVPCCQAAGTTTALLIVSRDPVFAQEHNANIAPTARRRRNAHGEKSSRVAFIEIIAVSQSRSWHKNGRAFEPTRPEIGEGLVGLIKRIARGFGNNADLRHDAQKIDSVLSGEIGDRNELAFFP